MCGLRPRIKRPVVPSRTPYPRSYSRRMLDILQFARNMFKKNRLAPFAIAFRIHNYEQVPIVQRKSLADR